MSPKPRGATCWLARFTDTPCQGRLVRAHLIPRQLLKREGFGAVIPDPRSWVWACGGVVGSGGHHGALDYARTLRVPRAALPPGVEQLAVELDGKLGREVFAVFLDREYGSP